MSIQDKLTLMTETAREAGQLALKFLENIDDMPVHFKGQADLLCEADEQVEQYIYTQLTQAHSDIAFLGEEGGLRGSEASELRWVVDPIDGTTNYLSGLPFTISIALVKGVTPIAGVIYAPVADEMFTASEGKGAYLNGQKMKVREQADPARYVLGTGLPLDLYSFSENAYQRLHHIREQVAAIRIIGSCALSLAHVACGRLDGYFEGPTGFLDAAAGLILVSEAGGVTTDFWGNDEYPDNVTFVSGAKACQTFITETTGTAPRS